MDDSVPDRPGPVRPEWLALHTEPAIDPDLPIVDAHHHLFRHPGWTYLTDDYVADLAGGHNIVASVFVQCFTMYRSEGDERFMPVGETEFVEAIAANRAATAQPICSAIVGCADLHLGDRVEDVLVAHLAASPQRFRGIRQIVASDRDPALQEPFNAPAGLMADANFRRGFARLAPLGLSFDALIYSPQLPELIALAQAFPTTTIVLDHAGCPPGVGLYAGRRMELFDRWRRDMRQLATCANVFVKLGGMAQQANGFGWSTASRPPSSRELADAWRPYFETCIELFSPGRCMLESNFPIDKLSCGYTVFWNACKRIAKGLDHVAHADLFAGTAARTYRLDQVWRQ